MIPAVRQEKILEILSNNEIVTVESLMNELQVSVSTLRRDLIKLEGEKKITLLHGGGVRLAPKTVELNIFTKLEMNKDAKERIARKAAGLVEDGDTIFLDPSSTTYLMIPFLAGKDITVLTNGISHINSWLRLISPASWWAVPSKNHQLLHRPYHGNHPSNLIFQQVLSGRQWFFHNLRHYKPRYQRACYQASGPEQFLSALFFNRSYQIRDCDHGPDSQSGSVPYPDR